jgi:NCS1 family nucleobase:cation symporter-1
MVANFIPPAYDLSNLVPGKINFRIGGLITAGFGFVIGGLWVAVITKMGMFPFVNTLGAILAPVFGIMICDYYLIKKEKLDVNDLFNATGGKYYYNGGFNSKAMYAWIISGYVAMGTVWPNLLIFDVLKDFFANAGGGFAWIIGAALGAIIHLAISQKK